MICKSATCHVASREVPQRATARALFLQVGQDSHKKRSNSGKGASLWGQKDLLGGWPHLLLGDENAYVVMTSLVLKIPKWPVKTIFSGEVVTAIRLGIQFWFGVLGLAQVTSMRPCYFFLAISCSSKIEKRNAKLSVHSTIMKHLLCVRHCFSLEDTSEWVVFSQLMCALYPREQLLHVYNSRQTCK